MPALFITHVKAVQVAVNVPFGPWLPAGSVMVTVCVAVAALPQTSVAVSTTV